MNLPVQFAPEAKNNIARLVSWAGQHSSTARLNLLAAIADKLKLIEQMPEMYAVLPEHPTIRRCVVSPTVSLYYRIQPAAVEIVAAVDTRRDPGLLMLPA